ncbi:helix-turn-helix domain-containing protein [Halomarina salina]|uniref:Helix-turn-helix domain-containing protein n=1 Tax=Halomarina salina TaxID=1872699 RepID=A0ABD5RPH3_9EURY|nr:helix-turn-helix domain-containing protein [Halomarina salina]
MIVEFTIQQPTLLQTLRAAPSTRVIWQQTDSTANDERLILFWAESDDYDAFEQAMYDDPTVTGPKTLTKFSDRRLYHVEQTGEGIAQAVYPSIVEVGGIVQQCIATQEGWWYQVAFPDNDALTHFHDTCTDHDLDFRLERKYEEADDDNPSGSYGLTEKQREMLAHAIEQGYYEVPRATNLDCIAEEQDISHQAASERLRRAVEVLGQHTIMTTAEPTGQTAQESDAPDPSEGSGQSAN